MVTPDNERPLLKELIQRESRCKTCGRTIYLVKVGKDSFKWVPNPRKAFDWKCPTKGYPIRAHLPESYDA